MAGTISLKFRWHVVPVTMFGLGVLKVLLTYSIAVVTGYVDPVFPYISTVASGYPQRAIFLCLAFVLTILLLACVYIRFYFLKDVLSRSDWIDSASDATERNAVNGNGNGNSSSCTDNTQLSAVKYDGLNVKVGNCRKTDEARRGSQQGKKCCTQGGQVRLNVAEFTIGIIMTFSYIGVCCVPETINTVRMAHTALALILFSSSSFYIIFDCVLSFLLLQTNQRVFYAVEQDPDTQKRATADSKFVVMRLIIVIFSFTLCLIGVILLNYAGDPLEPHFGNVLKPKVRHIASDSEDSSYNGTATERIYTGSTKVPCCEADKQVLQIATAIIEWLITFAVLLYFVTFYPEFKLIGHKGSSVERFTVELSTDGANRVLL